MPDAMDTMDIDKEGKRIMKEWDGWRPILVHLESLLAWERPIDPAIIFGATTLVFLLFWYLDPTILTTVSTLGFIFVLTDFLVPSLAGQFLKADSGKKWENICRTMASKKLSACCFTRSLANLRQTQPKMFYAVALPALFVLAWIGGQINNTLLTYFVVLAVLMIPGLSRRGWLDPVFKLLPGHRISAKQE